MKDLQTKTFVYLYQEIEDKDGFIEMCNDERDSDSFDKNGEKEMQRLANLFLLRIVDKEYLDKDGKLTYESSQSTCTEEEFEEDFSKNYSIYNDSYLSNDF